MRCIRPIKAGFSALGDIVYSKQSASKELCGFEFECRKCLPCRLNIAREKAIRALHESKMHEENIFLTLTYNEESLESPRLQYEHWQGFIKDLRSKVGYSPDKRISTMVTGEYGDKNKRPHWHALIFNFSPHDQAPKYRTDLGDQVYTSDSLSQLWGRGNIEYGSVTIESAGYVARYAAKKLAHGLDQDHDYHPIHKTSSKNAIGKAWIEKYHQHTFENGHVILPNGTKSRIPRYYIDWCKKNKPDLFWYYISEVRPKIQKIAEENARKEEMQYLSQLSTYKGGVGLYPMTRSKVKETILKSKFELLQERLKL